MAINFSMISAQNTKNFYSSLFSNDNTSRNSRSSMVDSFGSAGSIISDYSLIKSGSYKKLLKAYYKEAAANDTTKKKGYVTSNKDVDSTASLQNVKKEAQDLAKSAKALNNDALYKATGKDKNGKAEYNTDKIAGNVKTFVNDYNSLVKAAGDMNSTSVLRNTLNMVNDTSANKKMLSDVGITINKDNTLSVDEEKLKSADTNKLNSLFSGRGSWGSNVTLSASKVYSSANSDIYNNTHASSYTYRGSYTVMGASSNAYDNFF